MADDRESEEITWCYPDKRGVLPLEGFHIPKKLKRQFCQYPFEITIDTDFEGVIRACAEPTAQRPDTWINPVIEDVYNELSTLGYAHSVECWQGGVLVGGLYGVALGGAFFGESMFSREPNASKIALVALIIILREGGYSLLDTQYVNDHLLQFGIKEVPANIYMHSLKQALGKDANFHLPESWASFLR